MELLIGLAMKFWQWTVLIAVVIVAAVINFTDKRAKTKMFPSLLAWGFQGPSDSAPKP